MKLKSIFLGVAAVTGGFFSVNAQHTTLHELFTGENCPPCATYDPPFWALCGSATNANKIVYLTYMCPIPSTGGFYQSRQTQLSPRQSYYSVPFAPWGGYDGGGAPGTGNVASFNQTHIDNQYAIPSPFTITATHYFNATNDTVFGTVKVKATSAVSASLFKLRTAFTKTMHFASSAGSNGTKNFPNVVRAMFTNTVVAATSSAGTGGQAMKANWAVGDSVVYTYKGRIGKLDSALAVSKPFTQIDSNFFVWIQNDTTSGADAKRVYVAAKSTYQLPSTTGIFVNFASSISDVAIFPNPANNNLNVQCSLLEPSSVNVRIINSIGQTVIEKSYPAGGTQFSQNISLGNISNGSYMITVSSNNGTITKQFTVNK